MSVRRISQLSRCISRENLRRAAHVRTFCSKPSRMLVRDFIALSLYEENSGYFTSKEVVGSLGRPSGLDFRDVLNQMEYRQLLSKAVRAVSYECMHA